jgi:hypothetical protein
MPGGGLAIPRRREIMAAMRALVRIVAVMVGVVVGGAVVPPAVAAPPAAPPPQPPLAQPIERRLHSDTIDASSFLWNDWNKFVENYHPNYVADDDPATAWVEGARGSGAGEWLRIQITPLDRTTRIRLHIRNGYQKSKDLFAANARARQVTLRLLPSKTETKVTLADKDGWQDAVIEQPSGPVRAVELVVNSVYEGKKYEDLCISDIQVFATSLTPDNPAFEKSKHKTLMDWRAARLAAARTFKDQKLPLPLYPAYEVTTTELETSGFDLAEMVEAAGHDTAFAKEWHDALAVATAAVADLDALPRAQIAPTSQSRLIEADGLKIVRMRDIGGDIAYVDEGALHLPMLDFVSTLFTDQLRVLDVKDGTKIGAFLQQEGRCKADLAWVKRSAPGGPTGPAQVQAVVIGRCAKLEAREGTFNARAIELYVYDASGRLALAAANGHIDAYRWVKDGERWMLAGGRGLLAQGKIIEAKRRDAVAAR